MLGNPNLLSCKSSIFVCNYLGNHGGEVHFAPAPAPSIPRFFVIKNGSAVLGFTFSLIFFVFKIVYESQLSWSKINKGVLPEEIHLIHKAWNEHGVEALWTGQKNILLSCPQCLDSMLTPGFMNSVY